MHPLSEQVIEETFAQYNEMPSDKIPDKFFGTTILHIYPAEDTRGDDGDLNGYYQNLFFNLVIFNIHKGVYKMWRAGKFDAVFTDSCHIENLTVFKDGAFCIKIAKPVKFLNGQACTFYV